MISPEKLRRYPYFAGVSGESLKAIAVVADEESVPSATTMFSEGDPAKKLYIIVKGQVDIQYTLGSGELRTVDTLVDGDLLVWSALVDPHKCTTVGTTAQDTQLIAIDAAKLNDLCDADPLLGYRLMSQVSKLLAHRLEGARIQLATID